VYLGLQVVGGPRVFIKSLIMFSLLMGWAPFITLS